MFLSYFICGAAECGINVSPQPENTNVINTVWTMVMDRVMNVIDNVMDENIAGDECDGCDGKNKNSSELENKVELSLRCNTKNESSLEKKEISKEFFIMPSYPSQQKAQTYAEQSVMDSSDTITVGNKVTIDDCPGHWSSFSPFTVEAIEGKLVKLAMVEELIEIESLSKVQEN